jgi:hypothetical protein
MLVARIKDWDAMDSRTILKMPALQQHRRTPSRCKSGFEIDMNVQSLQVAFHVFDDIFFGGSLEEYCRTTLENVKKALPYDGVTD